MVIENPAFVSAIYITPIAAKLPQSVDAVRAIAGEGLEGDRYCSGQGTWSHWPGGGRQVTLIEAEVLAVLEESLGITGAQARRNIVTQGVRLNDMVGLDFRIGEVTMKGIRLCEPCTHLEKLSVRGAASVLEGCGGLRADILHGGVISVGDNLSLLSGSLAS